MPGSSSEGQYLHGHHDSVLRSHRQRTVENSAAYLLPRLHPAAKVADVGCGPGTITIGLATRVPEGQVVGIDSAPEVLEEARAEVPEGQSNISFEIGDLHHLQFGDATFDVVHAHQVLQHLSDPVAALTEMRRVCRPEGLVAVRDADFGGMHWYPASPDLDEWRALYRDVAHGLGGEPDAGRHLLSWARTAGFSGVELSASIWCFSSREERHWWGGLWAERVTRSRFAEQAIGSRLATPYDLERLADAWRTWMAAEDACFFVPHGELLCSP
ncbi:MAG: class I SAM-dependent methyltransferase [Acidimicrobiales bacterium]